MKHSQAQWRQADGASHPTHPTPHPLPPFLTRRWERTFLVGRAVVQCSQMKNYCVSLVSSGREELRRIFPGNTESQWGISERANGLSWTVSWDISSFVRLLFHSVSDWCRQTRCKARPTGQRLDADCSIGYLGSRIEQSKRQSKIKWEQQSVSEWITAKPKRRTNKMNSPITKKRYSMTASLPEHLVSLVLFVFILEIRGTGQTIFHQLLMQIV